MAKRISLDVSWEIRDSGLELIRCFFENSILWKNALKFGVTECVVKCLRDEELYTRANALICVKVCRFIFLLTKGNEQNF